MNSFLATDIYEAQAARNKNAIKRMSPRSLKHAGKRAVKNSNSLHFIAKNRDGCSERVAENKCNNYCKNRGKVCDSCTQIDSKKCSFRCYCAGNDFNNGGDSAPRNVMGE